MRKRIGALGLAAVLLLAMICPALAAGTKFVVKGPEEAPKKGETFTVVVELENNPGFNAIQFTMTYDKDKVTCTSIGLGELMSGMISDFNPAASKGAIVAAASANEVAEDGLAAVFRFTAQSDLTGKEYSLLINSFRNEEGNDIPYQVEVTGADEEDEPTAADPTSVEPAPQPEPEPEPELAPAPEPVPSPEPAPQPVESITFTDTKGHWGENFIARAAELGLFKGYPDGRFQPNLNVTRAQYVTVLYRMAGSPAVSGEAPFDDIVNLSLEFRTAIAWGYENGYLNGRSKDVFDPNGPVTRQEAMKILFGYNGGVSGMEAMFTAIYDDYYTDSGELAVWGKSPMYWGVYHSLITGTSETMLSPNGTATRAQLAKILTVYYDQQNKE